MAARMSPRTASAGKLAAAALCLAAALCTFATGAPAAPRVYLSGPQSLGPLTPGADGRFSFTGVPLRKNSVDTFTVTAVDDAGSSLSREVSITQVSLDAIVVSQVSAERLSVQEVEQLVADGTIKLDDPGNFNVSRFDIVLTIAEQPVRVSVPVATPKEEKTTGWETYKFPRGDGSGSSPQNQPPIEIVVFEQPVPAGPGDVAPPSIPGVIIIEGNIKSLKEFYNVRLMLMNTSGIFTLKDITASLSFPDAGLSNVLPADGIVSFSEIPPGSGGQPGQAERQFTIRGDEIGTRRIGVDFGGYVAGPGIAADAPIPFNGGAETSVEVKGPPTFDVKVYHPSSVQANVPYELTVDIRNTGDIEAMYASLGIDVGGDATIVRCTTDEKGDPVCEDLEEGDTRSLGHLLVGDSQRETFTILPLVSGAVTSCVGAADQNISLQVTVGVIGCATGTFPPTRGVPDGVPTVSVVPTANATGLGIDTPVTAFFSERMDTATITIGEGGSFTVVDRGNNRVPGHLRLEEINGRTVAVWQVEDGITNRLAPDTQYTVLLTDAVKDLDGNPLFSSWTSTFVTTGMGIHDTTPPALTLSVQSPVNANFVLPGQIARIDAYASDQGSGVVRVEMRIRDQSVSGSEYALADQRTVFSGDAPPYVFSVNSANLTAGHLYQVKCTAFDYTGNSQDAVITLVIASHADPPTVTLPADPAIPVLQGISVPLTPAAVTGGVIEVAYYLDAEAAPYKTVALAPYQATLATLSLDLGAHAIRAVARDGLGQTGEDTYEFELAQNLARPTVAFISPASGAQYLQGRSFSVTGSATDAVGIASVRFLLDGTDGEPIATGTGAFLVDTTNLAIGAHRIYLLAVNDLGLANDLNDPASYLDFSVLALPDGEPPPAPTVTGLTWPENGRVTLTGASNANARVDVTNVSRAFGFSVQADGSGHFSTRLDADAGNVLGLVAYDFTISQRPSDQTLVTVPAAPALVSLAVSPTTLSFTASGAYRDLAVTGTYDDATTRDLTARASFSSSDASVVSVGSSGRAVAQGNGQAVITAAVGSVQATVTVEVAILVLSGISVEPPAVSFTSAGQTQALSVTGLWSNGASQALAGASFATGDTNVATVTVSGLVSATGSGSTTISVYYPGVAAVQVGVTVDAAQNQAPTATILSPAAGATVERGQTVSVSVRAQDGDGGVTSVILGASGETTYAETRQIAPPAADATQSFSFAVSGSAAIGGSIALAATATDTGGGTSAPATVELTVVDQTAPTVTILQPAAGAAFNYGDTVNLAIGAADAVGVASIRYATSGALTLGETRLISPASQTAQADFSFTIPYGVVDPDLTITAYATDAAGNERAGFPIDIVITDADITAPQTVATAVAAPGTNASTTVTYQILSGLSDLDHVELYFRRNRIGTYNRYLGALGQGDGRYTPSAGDAGTILFDSTRMGGDGEYEFYTVGVDKAGNREPPPTDAEAVTPDRTASFNAGTVWTVITSPTVIGEGDAAYEDRNLRISGATVTVNGPHAFQNVEILNGGALTHSPATTDSEYRLDVTAWSVAIDGTSAITADGKGYLGGQASSEAGRTIGNVYGSAAGAGGSYGGLGGGYQSAAPNGVYGDLTDPDELGSGGGAWSNEDGGAGGGLVKLSAINIAVDGSVRSNGSESAGSAAGDGSGGGINIQAKSVSGGGMVRANGGGSGNGVGAGGGRIAIACVDMETLDQNNVEALGGSGYYGSGANGTVVFIRSNKAELVLEGQGTSSPWIDLTLPPGAVFDSVTLRNDARVVAHDAFTVTGRVLLTGNSTLTHAAGDEDGLVINARLVQIDAGSAIDATGKGCTGGTAHDEAGQTLGGGYGADAGAGGSYGGTGSGYQGRASGPIYGDPKNPVHLGSGGGAWGNEDGGRGGGRVTINTTQAIVVDGAIRANGGESGGSAAGDGSGGSVLLRTSKLAGSGGITANGGGAGNGTGGGGGRVAVYCDYVQADNDLNGLYNLTAFGRTGYYDTRRTTPGTVFVKYSSQQEGDLYVDGGIVDAAGNPNASNPDSTVLPALGFGAAAAVTADALTTDGLVAMFPGALSGIRINPDVDQQETFAIVGNTETTVTVQTPNEHGVAFAAVAGAGRTYAATYVFDNLTFRRGGNLMLDDILEVTGTMSIAEYGVLTHADATVTRASRLDVRVDTIDIDATGRIDVTGRGYLGGRGSNESGRTQGNASGAAAGAGGSHGGLATGYQGRASNALYGSLTNPADQGSGGGSWGNDIGGDGGGVVLLRADRLRVDGAIIADGGESGGSAAGDGSGGSVNLRVGRLSGTGVIRANGGGQGNGSGGGGGRVAVVYSEALTLPQENIRALGGTGYYGSPGGNGTVYLMGPGEAYGSLIVDGQGRSSPADTTAIPGGYTFDSVTLRDGAQVVADEEITVIGTLLVTGDSVLTHSSGLESGLAITAAVVQVDAGSAIDATGRGYPGGAGSYDGGITLGGVPGSSAGAGGSYGGLGGGYEGRSSALAYGDPAAPVHLGSGGGAWGNAGGRGGGRITIDAALEVIVDGVVASDGAGGSGSAAGSGSGGSVLIRSPLVSGSGYVQANGGSAGVGGGGGRVAIFCDGFGPSGDLDGLRNVTAWGGHAHYDDRQASAGTVFVKYTGQTYGDLFIDNNFVDAGGAPSGTAAVSTPLTPIGFGTTAEATVDTLTTDGLVASLAGGLVGLKINPDVSQAESFTIVANTGGTIVVETPNENGAHFGDLAAAGKTYAGTYRYDNVFFKRGGNLVLGDPLQVIDTLSISEYGSLTHYGATSSFTSRLDLTVGNLVIDATGRIDVTGRGYIGGPTGYDLGRTLGNVPGGSPGTGGSYGGLAVGYEGRASNPLYGSSTDPVDLGSGGGAWGSAGGSGGGLVLIRAGAVTLDGAVIADGGRSAGSAAGSGSGGSVNIHAVSVAGSGTVHANGGSAGAAGGGGRVAIVYSGSLTLPAENVRALGAAGPYGSGGAGTVHLEHEDPGLLPDPRP